MSRYRVILSENFVTVEQIEQPPITIERIGYNRYKVVLTATGRIFVLGDVTETGTGSVDINAAFQLAAELNEMGVGSSEISALFNVSGEVTEGGTGSIRVFSGQELEGLISEAGFGSVNIAAAFELAGNVLESGVGAVEITALFNVAGEASEAGIGSVKVFSGFELSGEANEAGVGSVVVEEEVGIDPDYQAVLDYATSKGWALPSAPQQTKGNQLVLDLKAAGIWSKLYFYYPAETDGDVDFGCINWKDPKDSTNLTRFNSPIYAANSGFKGDGVSAYLQMPYNPVALSWSDTSFAFGGFDFDNITEGNSALFADSAILAINQRLFINARNASNQLVVRANNSGATSFSSVTDSRGLHHIDRGSGSEVNVAKNGTSLGLTTLAADGFFDGDLVSLRFANSYSTRRVGHLFAATSFWADRAAFNTAISNYRAGL